MWRSAAGSPTAMGFETMSKQEQTDAGVNDSIIHVDFMVGANDLSVTGFKDGRAVKVFENGTWAEGFGG